MVRINLGSSLSLSLVWKERRMSLMFPIKIYDGLERRLGKECAKILSRFVTNDRVEGLTNR